MTPRISGGKVAEDILGYLRRNGGRAHINIAKFSRTLGCEEPSEVGDLLAVFIKEGLISRAPRQERKRTEVVPTEYCLHERQMMIDELNVQRQEILKLREEVARLKKLSETNTLI